MITKKDVYRKKKQPAGLPECGCAIRFLHVKCTVKVFHRDQRVQCLAVIQTWIHIILTNDCMLVIMTSSKL